MREIYREHALMTKKQNGAAVSLAGPDKERIKEVVMDQVGTRQACTS